MTRYVPFDLLREHMTEENTARALAALPGLRGVLVYVFPYFAGDSEGNISLYARGKDYHTVAGRLLEERCARLRAKHTGSTFLPYVDASPFPEVYAAAAAGLGVIGKNNLLITPEYGSYVFIGIIATDALADTLAEGGYPTPASTPGDGANTTAGNTPTSADRAPTPAIQACIGCLACIRACPGGALREGTFDKTACLSDITQRKGELSEAERELVKGGGMIWGCDICQTVCPMNRTAALTDIGEFRDDLILSLSAADIPSTNREFKAKYGAYAFSWRGRAPLARNGEILDKK